MASMTSRLVVLINNKVVGYLWLDETKKFCFEYSKKWIESCKIPLSLSISIREEPYLNDEAHAFFANLLPEQKMREVVARNLGVSKQNDYGLLEKIGGDCAGAVSVYPDGKTFPKETHRYRKLSLLELKGIINDLPQRPLLAGEKGIRLSLAGAQKKLPIYYRDETFQLSDGRAPSNFILKPAIEGLDGTVENEAFCMRLAKEIGLDVPKSFIADLEGLLVFAISRYDRKSTNGKIERIHQEDFCQALNIPPEFKYEAEGGPGFAQSVNLVREKSVKAMKDIASLLDWLIFNFLVGNSDAHGKNISFLLLPSGPVLAPFYDLLSTRIYHHYGLAEGLAMKIGGESDPSKIRRENWEHLSQDIGIKPRYTIDRIRYLAKKIELNRLRLFKETFALYKCDALYRLNQFIAESCEKVQKIL
jgi:serine/threonine-protein kinase HipA